MQTERLELRPFATSDAAELFTLFRNPEVRRFLLDDTLVPLEWVHAEVEASQCRFNASGTGLWAIRRIGSSPVIGFVGFREFFDPPQLQLIYGLAPQAWGQGFATEAARAVCAHAFQNLGLAHVAAAIDVPNVASARVLGRLGMRHVRTTTEGAAGTAFYRLDP